MNQIFMQVSENDNCSRRDERRSTIYTQMMNSMQKCLKGEHIQ